MPDLHDLAPVVDVDAAWHIFTHAARRRRTRRRLVGVLTTVAVVIAALGFAHFARQGSSRARVDIVGQPTVVADTTIPLLHVCAPAQLSATVGFVNNSSEGLGGVVLANHAATPCTLSGHPDIRMSTSGGRDLDVQQAPGVAGNTPVSNPNRPVVLSAHSIQPQAGVVLAWRNWCAAPPGAVVVSVQFAAWRGGNLVASPAAHADTNTVPPCTNPTRPTTITVGSVEAHDATGFVEPPSQSPESPPVVVPSSLPPESIPQGIINDASVPFHSSDVAIENLWQIIYKGYEVQVYFGAQVVNGEYNTALESSTAQGLAIVMKTPDGSSTAGPADVTGFRFHTPQTTGALRAVSATATTVTATTPGGETVTYDVTTGRFTAG